MLLALFLVTAGVSVTLLEATAYASNRSSASSPSSPSSPSSKSVSGVTASGESSSGLSLSTPSGPTISVSPLSTGGSSGPSVADLDDAQAMLENEVAHGWDSCYNGLYINWDEVNGRTVGNWNGTGQPDPSPCTRHEDRMTTLRFLDGLLLYKADTGSAEFNSEISTIEAHILTLFTTANADPRGWAWDTMTQIAQLSGNAQFTAIANAMLKLYATSPANNSRPDWQIEEASALVQSGVPSYVTLGTSELRAYWSANYLPNVELVNEPTEMVTADQGDIAVALAKAGFTAQAEDVLAGMEAHLWDPAYGGFGEGTVLSANGTLSFKNKKTGGRMMNMMTLGKDLDDSSLVSTMDTLFQQHIYQASPAGYQGVLYEQQQDWQPYVLGGTTENWTTSEAMGISYIALLSPN